MSCKPPRNSFNMLAGVPVHYDRIDVVGGKSKQLDFHCTLALELALNECFRDLWNCTPAGEADIILSAGTFAPRGGSQHCYGKAFDLDGIIWGDTTILAKDFPKVTEVYLGIEAVLHKHFGVVLGYHYNRRHQDHWHIDSSRRPGFRSGSRSCGLYLQLSLRELFGADIGIDGIVGPNTLAAARTVMEDVGLITDRPAMTDGQIIAAIKARWFEYLDICAFAGMAANDGKPKGPQTPGQLWDNIRETVDHQLERDQWVRASMASKTINDALNKFVRHEDVLKLLSS